MLKPVTLSLSLAVALGFCSVSMAGIHDHLASPQSGPIASPQGVIVDSCGGSGCGGGFHLPKCDIFKKLGGHFSGLHCKLKSALHPPVTYEWVLKKKRLWGHKGGCDTGCDTAPVYPTSQVVPSGQGVTYPAPQAAPQAAPVYGAGQHTYRAAKPAPTIASVPAEMTQSLTGDEAPPAPEVGTTGLLLPTPVGN